MIKVVISSIRKKDILFNIYFGTMVMKLEKIVKSPPQNI